MATCYHRDQTASSYVPCANGTDSACCNGDADDCRDDGLCYFKSEQTFWRDGCTDPTWRAEACSPLCPHVGQSAAVTVCADGSYCCGEANYECCLSGQGVRLNEKNQIISSSSVSASSTSSSATSSPTTSPSSQSRSLDTSSKIALGIGIPLGVAIIAVLLWLLFRDRKRQREFENRTLDQVGKGATTPGHQAPVYPTADTMWERAELPR